jgi:uncharacterized protein with PIN domain
LTSNRTGLKYGQFVDRMGPNYEFDPDSNHCEKISPNQTIMEKTCKHTRVRVVARDDDAEFVECQECGDVFEASEFKDMAIEEEIRPEEA